MGVVDEIYSKNSVRKPVVKNMRTRKPISLIASLKNSKEHGNVPIIGEFKRSSPSGFSLRSGIEISSYLTYLKREGISALSILTEPDYFRGSYMDLKVAHEYGIPVLAKDFISDTLMIDSAYNAGADAILLIADFLQKEKISDLSKYALSLGIEVLTEFHEPSSLGRYTKSAGTMLGYNRRNLRTMEIEDHLDTVFPDMQQSGTTLILESGLDWKAISPDLQKKFDGFLIGTTILNEGSVE